MKSTIWRVSNEQVPLPRPLKVYLCTAAILTGLSGLVAWIETLRWGVARGFQGFWLAGPGYDFYDYYPRFRYRHTMEFFAHGGYAWYYPAPAIFIHAPFYVLVRQTGSVWFGYAVYLVLTGLLTFVLAFLFGRELYTRGLDRRRAVLFSGGLLLSCYPIYFAAQRGNIEALTWMLLGLGVWAILVDRPRLGSVLLGVAAAVKIYPGLFLALFLARRGQERWVALGLGVFVVLTAAAIWYLDPNFLESAVWVADGVKRWTFDYTKDVPNDPWDHSVFAQVRLLLHTSNDSFRHALRLYYLTAPAIACALAWRVRRLPVANQVLFISCAAITLPPASFDYTLCMMYVPLALIAALAVSAASRSLQIPGLAAVMALLALVISPEMFAMTTQVQWVPETIKCVALLLLILASAWWPMQLSAGIPSRATRVSRAGL